MICWTSSLTDLDMAMKKSAHFHKKNEKRVGTEQEGLLVSLFGKSAEVETQTGEIVRCHLKKNQEPIAVGDRVLWLPEHDHTGVIVTHLPRTSLLAREERPGKTRLLAANVDFIIIVSAPLPAFSSYLVDRYLIAAENLKIPAAILLNKMDLLNEQDCKAMHAFLNPYEKIGYPVLFSSALSDDGMQTLNEFLQQKTAVFVGASGVGKSSIIAKLTHNSDIPIGSVADTGVGKHTTTLTRLYHAPLQINLIDSPGVREFGLAHLSKKEIVQGFIEFKNYSAECKFRNCQHLEEPDCAVKKAVATGEISQERFRHYCELLGVVE